MNCIQTHIQVLDYGGYIQTEHKVGFNYPLGVILPVVLDFSEICIMTSVVGLLRAELVPSHDASQRSVIINPRWPTIYENSLLLVKISQESSNICKFFNKISMIIYNVLSSEKSCHFVVPLKKGF